MGKMFKTANMIDKNAVNSQNLFQSHFSGKIFPIVINPPTDSGDFLINLNLEFKTLVDELKANKNSNEFEKYENISYSDTQLKESVARLYIYYSDIKIENLIKEMDESNDLTLLEDLEGLKKKIEFYQNTL